MHRERQYLEMMSGMKMLDVRHKLKEKYVTMSYNSHFYSNEITLSTEDKCIGVT